TFVEEALQIHGLLSPPVPPTPFKQSTPITSWSDVTILAESLARNPAQSLASAHNTAAGALSLLKKVEEFITTAHGVDGVEVVNSCYAASPTASPALSSASASLIPSLQAIRISVLKAVTSSLFNAMYGATQNTPPTPPNVVAPTPAKKRGPNSAEYRASLTTPKPNMSSKSAQVTGSAGPLKKRAKHAAAAAAAATQN
ncbi:hypothetical protein TrRE_jg11081, partial [Triparma retinervis]